MSSYTVDIGNSFEEGTYEAWIRIISYVTNTVSDTQMIYEPFKVTHQTPVEPTEIRDNGAFFVDTLTSQHTPGAGIVPSNTTMTWLKCESDNTSVCEVSSGFGGGVYFPKSEGIANITITSENGIKYFTKIYVVSSGNMVYPTKMTLPSKANMNVNETLTLEPKLEPSNVTVKEARAYDSSNPDVATVNPNGIVTAHKTGTVTISAYACDSPLEAKCVITVTKASNPDPDPDDPNPNPTDPTDPDDPDQADKVVKAKSVKTIPSIYVVKGKTATLPASVQPGNAANKKVTWSSTNKKTVSVNRTTGKIKGLKVGKTTVTVTTDDGKKKAKCIVYVVAKTTKVKALVAQKPIGLTVGKTTQIKVKTTPAKATGVVPKYSSSKKAVATIDKAGVITAKKLGTSVITIKAGGKTQKVTVTVGKVLPTKVTLNKKSISIKAKSTYKMTAKLTPAKANPKTVKWTSSNKKVATVGKNGKVKGIKKGKATITATTWNGKTVKCSVIVR